MYKLITKKAGRVTISKGGNIIIEDRIRHKTIKVEIDGQEINDIPDMDNIFSIYIFDDWMFVAYNNTENTIFYNKVNLTRAFQIEAKLYTDNISDDDIYIYIYIYKIIYQYHKQSHCLRNLDLNECRRFYYSRENIILFKEGDNMIKLCEILDNSVESVWRIDTFNDLFPNYNLDGNEDFSFSISEIKVYNGDFIVVTAAGIARLDAKTGKTVWKTEKRYCKWVEIVGQTGYISGGNKLSKINLETGVITGYGWRNDLLPLFLYEGYRCYPTGRDYVYHNGLLWFSARCDVGIFILAINPENGLYEWINKIGTNYNSYPPQFHDDKMYITDTNGNLFIYQKQD